MWLCECPFGDQGLVRPLLAQDGCVVMMCDSGGEVWLRPTDVLHGEPFYPAAPDWTVVCCIAVDPATTRWADEGEVEAMGWDADWQS